MNHPRPKLRPKKKPKPQILFHPDVLGGICAMMVLVDLGYPMEAMCVGYSPVANTENPESPKVVAQLNWDDKQFVLVPDLLEDEVLPSTEADLSARVTRTMAWWNRQPMEGRQERVKASWAHNAVPFICVRLVERGFAVPGPVTPPGGMLEMPGVGNA